MVLLKFGIRKLFPDDFAPKDLQGVSLRHGVELFDLEALQKGCVGHEHKAGFGQGHRCMMASAGLPVPLRGGAHRDFIPLAASVRWLERGESKSDCVTWSDLYLSTSRGKKFARTLLSFDDIVCADRFTVGSSKRIAEDLADKICDPGSLIRPGFYAHPRLGFLKEPVLDAQAVFKIPQSVAPPEAKNAEIVLALFEESGQAALRPDAVTVELVASVNARTKSMAAVADHLVARAQAATRLMGAAADNIEIFNHRQYLRVNSDAIDKEVRSASLDFDGRIPGRAGGYFNTGRPSGCFAAPTASRAIRGICTAELAF